MKSTGDLFPKCIFIILLFFVLYLFVKFYISKIYIYNYNTDIKQIYVNINAINIPDFNNHIEQNLTENISFTNKIDFPSFLSQTNYTYKAQTIPIKDLSANADASMLELKSTLSENLDNSLKYSKIKNQDIALLQNMTKIQNFENEARKIFLEKIKENTPLKTDSYLKALGNSNHMNIANTKSNREKADKSMAEYFLYKNAYLNYFYLYNLNVEQYIKQEQEKNISEVNNKFEKYEKSQKDILNNKIQSSQDIITGIIDNINIIDKNKTFSYQNINPVSKINKPKLKKISNNINNTNIYNFDKKQIIISIAKDNNYLVSFTNNKLPNKTEEIQNLINTYGYLYKL